MSKLEPTLFKQVNYSLSKLIQDIDIGEIGLPDIQRPFVWNATKVRDLFDSMYKGFPVGYLLFWANVSNGSRPIGSDIKQKSVPRLLIVDGQQRLTSLYAVLKNKTVKNTDYEDKFISIAFRPSDGFFEVSNIATSRDPEFINNISHLWSGQLSRNRFVKYFLDKLKKSREVSPDEEDRLSESIDRLYDLQNYPFTALELSPTVNEEDVAEVFVRINSQGTTLKQADFILTLMSVFWDEGRTELEKFCIDARKPSVSGISPFNHFIQPSPDELLRTSIGLGFRRARLKYVYSILRGKDLETGSFDDDRRVEQFDILRNAQEYVLDLKNWHEFLKVLLRAGFRSGDMLTSSLSVIYSYTMFLIGKRDYNIENDKLRNIIARWFFMASLTGRYSASPEGSMEQDLSRLRSIKNPEQFIQELDTIIKDTLTEDFWNITLPNELSTSASRSPSLFAYIASLNLLDAKVLFSNIKVSNLLDPSLKSKRAPIERHHLFPKKYLEKIGIDETSKTNQIANYALVEWSDNSAISDVSPEEYFPKYSHLMSEDMYFWHALPKNWETMNYEDFLSKRRKLIANVIRKAFGKLQNEIDETKQSNKKYTEWSLEECLDMGESDIVEYKSSMLWDYKNNTRSTDVQHAIAKTLAAFMNSDGGILIVGVSDDGKILGLEKDMLLFSERKNWDGWTQSLVNLIREQIGSDFLTNMITKRITKDNNIVAQIVVKPSHKPAFVESKDKNGKVRQEFFVRGLNTTQSLDSKQTVEYIKNRWR